MTQQTRPKHVAIAIELHWNLPWHLDCYQGIIDYGQKHGWECTIDPYLEGVTADDDLSGYDGAVGRIDSEIAPRVKAAGLHAVTLLASPALIDLPRVTSDVIATTRLGAEHLITNGYPRCVFVSSHSMFPDFQDRLFSAFHAAFERQGRPPPDRIGFVDADFDARGSGKAVRNAIARWIQALPKPVGLYIYHVDIARYVAQICRQFKIKIPDEVGILVHSADEVTAASISPTLSTIDFSHWEQGYQAANLLDKLMHGQPADPLHRLIRPRGLIVRESSDVFVCSDELVSQAMRYLAEHNREPLRVGAVAEALGVSRRTLDRRFLQVLGKTAAHEISRLRFREIERLLLQTDLTLTKVAEHCGFETTSHFSRFFSKQAGTSPGAFRKQHRR